MRYVMKQKLFSWGDDFVIRDESERDAFFVDGKAFSLGKQLSFQDMAGNELAFIRQKLLSWGPTYEIHRDGQLYAVVKKELFTLFRCRFTVDVPGPDDLEAEGDFMDHEYALTRGRATVAGVSKRWFAWTDTYGVDIADGEDDVPPGRSSNLTLPAWIHAGSVTSRRTERSRTGMAAGARRTRRAAGSGVWWGASPCLSCASCASLRQSGGRRGSGESGGHGVQRWAFSVGRSALGVQRWAFAFPPVECR